MKSQRPITSDDEHQVLQFRPRPRAPLHNETLHNEALHDETMRYHSQHRLQPFGQEPGQPDDFRHRMFANAAALAIMLALTAIGIWLTISIADRRKAQDCPLTAHGDCIRIATPHS